VDETHLNVLSHGEGRSKVETRNMMERTEGWIVCRLGRHVSRYRGMVLVIYERSFDLRRYRLFISKR